MTVFTLLTCLIGQPFNVMESLAEKPRGPLELSFSADPAPAPGEVVRMTLTVTSRVDAPELSISIELPNDLPHLSGELHWTGAVAKDQPVSLTFQVGPLEALSYEVVGRGTVTLPNGLTWTQATSMVLEPVTQEKPLPRFKRGRQGEAIKEIPVQ